MGVEEEERGYGHLGEAQERARAQKFTRKVKNCVDKEEDEGGSIGATTGTHRDDININRCNHVPNGKS